MKEILLVVQIIVSVLLALVILTQLRSAGLGTAFGGGSEHYRSKRGVEALLYRATIILIALFLITSIVNLLL